MNKKYLLLTGTALSALFAAASAHAETVYVASTSGGANDHAVTLGTMAGETATDYVKQSDISSLPATLSSLQTQINGKQTALTSDQLLAVNSGVTNAKVSQYDTLVTKEATYGNIVKHNASEFQTALDANQLLAVNSGVTNAKVAQYDTLVTKEATYGDIVTHNASEFQTALNSTQMQAVNSGVTSTKVGQYDALVTAAATYGDIVTHDASEFQAAEAGKGLSTNDYTAADKAKVDALGSASTKDVSFFQAAEAGKGLSTNDYTAADKAKVDALGSASTKDVSFFQAAETGKGLSTNDYSDADKAKVDALGSASTKDVSFFQAAEAGKGLSTNDFTNAYKNQVDTNKTDIANITKDGGTIDTKVSTAIAAAIDASGADTIAFNDGTNTGTAYKTSKVDSLLNAKQDNLVIGVSSGLLMDTDGKTLTVKADDSTLEVTSAGVKIKNSGVGSAQIADGSITGADIATQTITGNNLVNNTITATQIASNTITANEIAQNAITADELANDAVDTGAIKAGAVTLAKLNADVSTSTATNGDSRLMTSDGVFDITNVDTAGNYLQTGTNVAANLGKLDTAIGAKIAADGNVIKKSDTNSVNANISALDTAIGDMSDFATDNEFAVYSTVAQNLSALDSQLDTVTDVLGDAETGTAPTTGLLQELIGTDHTVIEDLRTVANNAAGKALDNTFTGANEFQGASTFKGATTFKNDNGFTVTDSTDSTSATFGVKTVDFTDLEDTTASNKILKVDVEDAMLVDGTLASTNGLSIVKETGTNKYTEVMAIDSNGNIETTGTLSAADGAFTVDGSGNTVVGDPANDYVKLNADGSLETTAGATVGNGLTVSAGGADITGNSTVKGTFGAGTTGAEFTVNGDGDVNANSLTTVAGVTVGNGLTVSAGGASITGDSTVTGKLKVTDDLKVGNDKFKVTASTGRVSAAGGQFLVKETGAVSAAAGKFEIKDGGLVSAAGGYFLIQDKGAFGLDNKTFTVDKDGNTKAASLTFNGTDKVNAIDTGTAAITDGAGNAQTMATTATVGKTVGSFANLTNGAITAKTDVTTAINSLAANVETATGGTFTAGVWAATVNNAKTAKAEYNYVESNDLMDAINQVATNVGTKAQLNELYNGVANDKTVNQNITAVNKTVGDITKLNGELKNLTNGTTTLPKTIVEALNNLDATLGTIHGLSTKLAENYKGNLAEGTTVEQHLTAIDASIGDRRLYNNTAGSNGYTATAGADVASAVTEIASNIGTAADLGVNQNGVNATKTVNANIASLNNALGDVSTLNTTHYASTATNVTDAVKAVDQGLYSLDQDVRSLRHHFEGGMASAAALSALQPNARATGNTQLALGTGAYKGHTAMALGGFHWVTDNLFLNAGVAWDNREATYRMGVTYSW